MDEVDVAAELEGVVAVGGGEDIGELDAVLVRLCNAGQSVGHAEGHDAGGDAGAGCVCAGSLKVRPHWAWTWLTEAVPIWVVRPPTRKRS